MSKLKGENNALTGGKARKTVQNRTARDLRNFRISHYEVEGRKVVELEGGDCMEISVREKEKTVRSKK